MCEYFENLISVQTLLLFNYTGSALKGDRKFVSLSKENACPKFQIKTINSAELEPLEILSFKKEVLVSGKQ